MSEITLDAIGRNAGQQSIMLLESSELIAGFIGVLFVIFGIYAWVKAGRHGESRAMAVTSILCGSLLLSVGTIAYISLLSTVGDTAQAEFEMIYGIIE